MRLKILFFALFASFAAIAINSPNLNPALPRIAPDADTQYTFDHLSGVPQARKFRLGTLLREAHNSLICVYDFATQGGAIGTYGLLAEDLRTPCTLPGRAVVRNSYVDVTTPVIPASPQGSIPYFSISTGQTSGDLFGVTSGTYAGQWLASPVFATVSTYIKLTTFNTVTTGMNANAYQPYVTISKNAATAGHFRVFIDYSISE